MKLGYACVNMTIPSKFKTCRLKTVEKEGLSIIRKLAIENLNETIKILKWNIHHHIDFYRLSSDIIPFATHPINQWKWWEDDEVLRLTLTIRKLKEQSSSRLSMHPGQYTILNTPNDKVYHNSLLDFHYHAMLMELTGATDMITHVGGAYGDKEAAKKRFIKRYHDLPNEIKEKLRLENDDKIFTIHDVLDIHQETNIPICFDYHHHRCHHTNFELNDEITTIVQSWGESQVPKIHLSSGKTSPTDRAHHDFILLKDYFDAVSLFKGYNIDIMFEAKMKEKSVLRIKRALSRKVKRKNTFIKGE